MKLLQVFDPAMCCSTGVCGPDVDPVLPRLAGFLSQLAAAGVRVERHNLAHEPMAFVRNAKVKALLDSEGVAVLPLFFVDGDLQLKAGYPDTELYARWMAQALAGTQA